MWRTISAQGVKGWVDIRDLGGSSLHFSKTPIPISWKQKGHVLMANITILSQCYPGFSRQCHNALLFTLKNVFLPGYPQYHFS